MNRYKIHTKYKKLLADTYTPVSIYLKLRDKFPNSILLESSDYHGHENSFSFICCKPLATFKVENGNIQTSFPDKKNKCEKLKERTSVIKELGNFIDRFEPQQNDFKFIHNGLFGYTSYDSVKYFEEINIQENKIESRNIPDMFYSIYQYVIAINHFNNELYIFEHTFIENESSIELIESWINNKNFPVYKFDATGKEESDYSDEEFLSIISKAKANCQRGDVFQIVLSRNFTQAFKGDEFNVYRVLRSINPSPYLFYFDYGNFKIFGSSPEAQLTIKNGEASIYPIAGTFKRVNDEMDKLIAKKLKSDPKENAEHIMLVDLARNDLSKTSTDVKVDVLKEVQYYSHVIHLVSKVTGKLNTAVKGNLSMLKIVADTFPAGTLSGAPKFKAMELINKYEKNNRGFYGGCIGFIGFNGDFNHAIMIRSFLSKSNILNYRAGAGIVVSSDDESELNEVNNKLLALKTAIKEACKL